MGDYDDDDNDDGLYRAMHNLFHIVLSVVDMVVKQGEAKLTLLRHELGGKLGNVD